MNRERNRSRRGTLVVCVLVCILVACSLMVAATQRALRMRSDARHQHRLRQTELLLDAGIRRAVAAARDAEYEGETWNPVSVEFSSVEIEVARRNQKRVATVTARIGSRPTSEPDTPVVADPARTQRTHTFTIPDNNASNAE